MKTKLIPLLILVFSFACGTKYDGPGIDPIYPTTSSCLDIDNLDKYSGSLGNMFLDIALENTSIQGSYVDYVTINARLTIGAYTYCCGSTQAGVLVLNNGSYNNMGFKNGDYGALTQSNLFCVPITPYAYQNVRLVIAPQNNLTTFMYLTNNKSLEGHINILINNAPAYFYIQ